MSAYIDETYVENALGAAVQTSIAPSGSVLTQFIAAASGMMDSALKGAGYEDSIPLTGTIPETVKTGTLGAFIHLAYIREGLPVPEAVSTYVNIFEGIRRGDIPIEGLSPNSTKGIGASKFTGSSSSTTGDKPKVMGGLRKLY